MNQVTTEVAMTIKEIAALTGKTTDTITKWVRKVDQNNNNSDQNNNNSDEIISSINEETTLINGKTTLSIKEKMSKASSTYPARFNEEEVIAIVRAGGNEILANLLLDNLQNKNAIAIPSANIDSRLDRIEAILKTLTTTFMEMQVMQIKEKHTELLEAPKPTRRRTHWTVREYFNKYFDNGHRVLNESEEYRLAEHCTMTCNECYHMKLKSTSGDIRDIEFPTAQLESTFQNQRGYMSW